MFENIKINGYTYATRYIASWVNVGGQLYTREDRDNFRNWLLSMELDEDKVDYIMHLATNGKYELQYRAEQFLNKATN